MVIERVLMNPNLDKKRILFYTVIIAIGVAIYHIFGNLDKVSEFLRYIYGILSPIVTGFIIAFIINIPMMKIEQLLFEKSKLSLRVRRGLSLTITILLLLSVFSLLGVIVIPQLIVNITNLLNNIPSLGQLSKLFNGFLLNVNLPEEMVEQITTVWKGIVDGTVSSLLGASTYVTSFVQVFFEGIFNAILSIVLAMYMLLGKERLIFSIRKFAHSYFPKKSIPYFGKVLRIMNQSFGNFLQGQITEGFVLAVICYIGMRIFQFEYALLISVLIGFTNIIPLFGAYIGGICAFLLLLMINPIQALWFLLFLVVLQQIESNLIYPRVVGTSMGISGIWIMIAVILGNSLMGLFGIIIGIPLMSTAYTLVSESMEKRLQKRKVVLREAGSEAAELVEITRETKNKED